MLSLRQYLALFVCLIIIATQVVLVHRINVGNTHAVNLQRLLNRKIEATRSLLDRVRGLESDLEDTQHELATTLLEEERRLDREGWEAIQRRVKEPLERQREAEALVVRQKTEARSEEMRGRLSEMETEQKNQFTLLTSLHEKQDGVQKLLLASISSSGHGGWKSRVDWWDSLNTDPLQKELFTYQHPAHCDRSRIVIMDHIYPKAAGHGSQVHYVSLALTYAMATDRVLVINDNSNWMLNAGRTEGGLFWNYFIRTSNCTMDNIGVSNPKSATAYDYNKKGMETNRVVRVNDNNLWSAFQKWWRHYVPDTYAWGGWVEGDKVKWRGGLLWWRSQLVFYILRPTEETWENVIDVEKRRLGFIPESARSCDGVRGKAYPIAGVHMRHGSSTTKTSEKRVQVPLSKYLSSADAILDPQGGGRTRADILASSAVVRDQPVVANILLSTEYHNEITKAIVDYPDRNFFHVDEVETDAHSLLIEKKKLNVPKLHRICIKNLFLQISCDAFVGTLKSNYGRMIYELSVATNHRLPVLSVDGLDWLANP
eukprot:TRINITY_DN636_c1_g1_i1.p1 TRINITY_DN636_c1_g1~~TRINITY_DN636_c1_g1_i1.p1  ORF type:complete len:542 (+),score=118.31 TRINITY_DN636_c1_g1_i1:299-1924(+)